MIGTNLENIKSLKVEGCNKLQKEIESCVRIPEVNRRFMVNHYLNEKGEGEPELKE